MPKRDPNAKFTGIDVDAFTGPLKKAWDAYTKVREPISEKITELQKQLAKPREEFEAVVKSELIRAGEMAEDQDVKFAYNWGGLAFLPVEQAEKRRKLVLGVNSENSKRR